MHFVVCARLRPILWVCMCVRVYLVFLCFCFENKVTRLNVSVRLWRSVHAASSAIIPREAESFFDDISNFRINIPNALHLSLYMHIAQYIFVHYFVGRHDGLLWTEKWESTWAAKSNGSVSSSRFHLVHFSSSKHNNCVTLKSMSFAFIPS